MKKIFGVVIILIFSVSSLQGDEEEKYLYWKIPDATISFSSGTTTSFQRFCNETPTIVTFAYSRCAGICYPYLFHLRDVMPGDDEWKNNYQILVLSFDERDTKENMTAMEAAMNLKRNLHWHFATIEKSRIQELAQSVGFEFTIDSLTGQINHPPIVVGVNANGKIVRIVKKFNITRNELWQVYNEIQGGFVPFYKENIQALISCFTYNAEQGKLNFSWGMLLLYAPVAIGAVIVWKIFTHQHRRVGILK